HLNFDYDRFWFQTRQAILFSHPQFCRSRKLSQIPPIRELHYHCAIAHGKGLGKIVIRIYNKQIRRGSVTPLKPRIEIDILLLFVELCKGGEVKIVCHGYIEARPDQPKPALVPWLRKAYVIVRGAQQETHI